MAKNLAVNHLPLAALPAVQTWTANCKRDRKTVVTWHPQVCRLRFPRKNLMLKVSNVGPRSRKRIRQGQNVDLSNRFIFSAVSRPRGRPVFTYHVTDCDW